MSGAGAIPIVALDVGSGEEALELARTLGDRCRFYKVGSELFTAAGPTSCAPCGRAAADVFLDLKFHDIPNTVAGAVRSAARLGARLVTVHASGGRPCSRPPSARRRGVGRSVRGPGRDGADVARRRPRSPRPGGGRTTWRWSTRCFGWPGWRPIPALHGIVCSGAEVAAVRERFGDRLAPLVPGIRLAGGATQDQARVMTPAAAQAAGARYLILGRAVTAAEDPAAAMERVLAELRDDA